MRWILPKPIALFGLLCAAFVPTPVHAQESYPTPLPPPIAAAPDDLSGHLILAPKVLYLVPTGSADSRLAQRDFVSAGPALGLDLAYGISRYVAIQARFDKGWFSSNDQCPSGKCKASSTGFGLGIEYHLVNGASFDPWMRVGVGYRLMNFEGQNSLIGGKSSLSYSGLEWLHLAVGGDWYASRSVGFGPYMALDVGTYSSRPDDSHGSAGHTFFSLGLRGVIDPWR